MAPLITGACPAKDVSSRLSEQAIDQQDRWGQATEHNTCLSLTSDCWDACWDSSTEEDVSFLLEGSWLPQPARYGSRQRRTREGLNLLHCIKAGCLEVDASLSRQSQHCRQIVTAVSLQHFLGCTVHGAHPIIKLHTMKLLSLVLLQRSTLLTATYPSREI